MIRKALVAALGAVLSVALLTAGTAAPAGARTPSASSAPSGAGAGPFLWYDCMKYYGDLSYCCYYTYDAPVSACLHTWYPAWSGAARSAPASPGRTD
ncbi:hypothetical protein [Nonomuraea maritima]|uniref:hypothetical protein n=1 Tax=Nonomuraea maritima TaxID=683260 RepID=UPI00371D01EC